jgi:RAD51-like protein 2
MLETIIGNRQVTMYCILLSTNTVGEPGVGKTQLCMQLALDCQISSTFGGVNGDVLYIDTEGSLHPSRFKEMAKHVKQHLKLAARRIGTTEALQEAESIAIDAFLHRVSYYRVYDHVQLLAVVKSLASVIDSHEKQPGAKPIKLIIMDSIAAPFRGFKMEELSNRSRILGSLVNDLRSVASKSKAAVVLVNQATTKVHSGGGADLVGALGETWKHQATHRIHLKFEGEIRTATLVKSSSLAQGTLTYRICPSGFRGEKVVVGTKRALGQ